MIYELPCNQCNNKIEIGENQYKYLTSTSDISKYICFNCRNLISIPVPQIKKYTDSFEETCITCGKIFSLKTWQYQTSCLKCRCREFSNINYDKNREYILLKCKEYYLKNKERIDARGAKFREKFKHQFDIRICPKCNKEIRYNGCNAKYSVIIKKDSLCKECYLKEVTAPEVVSRICPKCGKEIQYTGIGRRYKAIIFEGMMCKMCQGKYMRSKRKDTHSNTEKFITKAKVIHGNKFDYSKVNYINNYTKISIVCKNHGEYQQTPSNHLGGHGCDKCRGKVFLHN